MTPPFKLGRSLSVTTDHHWMQYDGTNCTSWLLSVGEFQASITKDFHHDRFSLEVFRYTDHDLDFTTLFESDFFEETHANTVLGRAMTAAEWFIRGALAR